MLGCFITRVLDLIIGLIGCLVLLLLLGPIALLIKLDSPGPVFYRARRVGKGGRLFHMYKFRTMYETPADIGPSVCPQGDPRVTPVGRVLRRLKLNEFPQFFNLLKGDMTLVGPRPEAPDLAAAYPEDAWKIFSVKPGLIGPNQILGRNEEEFYPPGVDPVRYYLEHLLPRKLAVDLAYLENKTLLRDLKYLVQTAWAVLAGAVSRRHFFDSRSQILLLLGDAGLCLASFSLVHLARYGVFTGRSGMAMLFQLLPLAVLIRLPVFVYFGFYQTLIRYLSLYDLKRVAKGVAVSSLTLVAASFFLDIIRGYSRVVFLLDWLCLTTLLVGLRVMLWGVRQRERYQNLAQVDKTPVLIWGAGDCGELCLRFLRNERDPAYEVVGFIDDDVSKRGKCLHGLKILGDRHHLELIVQLYRVRKVFVAIAKASAQELKSILERCRQAGLEAELFLARAEVARELASHQAPGSFANGYVFGVAGGEP